MMMRRIWVLSFCLFLSCYAPQPVLDIAAHHWPEGSSVSLLRNGKVVARSSLFGDHVRVTAPKPGVYTVRAASPEVITSVSPELEIGPGVAAYTLPLPVMRRRIGTTNLGFGFEAPGSDSVCVRLLDTSPMSFTSISLGPGVSEAAGDIIRRAHEKGIEVVLRGDCRGKRSPKAALKAMLSLADSAERYGADGIAFIPCSENGYKRGIVETVRELAGTVHERGMTLSLGLAAEELGLSRPIAFFDSIPAPECPDDIVLLCRGTGVAGGEIAVVSIPQIEEAVLTVRDARIPLSRVSVELMLSAVAYEENGKVGATRRVAPTLRKPVPITPGILERILPEAGEAGVLRLGDGSLRLGYRGVNYAWEDLDGIARKTAFLRTGEFARVRGIRIVWDGLGVKPDAKGISRLAKIFETTDGHR